MSFGTGPESAATDPGPDPNRARDPERFTGTNRGSLSEERPPWQFSTTQHTTAAGKLAQQLGQLSWAEGLLVLPGPSLAGQCCAHHLRAVSRSSRRDPIFAGSRTAVQGRVARQLPTRSPGLPPLHGSRQLLGQLYAQFVGQQLGQQLGHQLGQPMGVVCRRAKRPPVRR